MTPQQIGEEYAAATRDTNNGNTNTIINAQSTTSSRQLDENSTAALITSQQHNTHASANAAYTHEAVVISHENISSDSSKQLLDQSSLSCSAPSSPFSSIVPLNLFSPSSRDKLPTGQLGEMHFVGSARIEPINRRLLLGAEEDVVGGAREVEKKAVLDEEAEEQRNGISHGGTQQQQQGAPGGDMTLRRWSLGGLPREGLNEFDSYGTTSCSILGRDRVVVESVVTDDTKCLRNNTMSGTIDLVSSSASSDMSSSYSSSPSSSSSSGSFPASSSSSCSSYHKDPPPFSAANLVDSARVCVRDNTRGLMKRNVMLACVFTANTLTSIYTGIRCVRTRTIAEHEMPWSGVLSGLIVLWTNLEFGLLKRLVFSLTKDEGLLFPKLHLHKIHYQARLPGHSCDMCGDRIRGEAYRCRVCDFDCCLDCFKKQGKDKAEGLLRSDKGPHFEEYMSTWRYFLGAVGLMRPFAWLVCGACLCVVLTQGFNLMLPTIQGYIMDDIVRKDMQQFGQSVIQLVIFSSLSGLFGGVQKLMVGLVQRNLSVETRLRLFLTVLHQDVAFFDGLMTGQIISRVILDANAMVEPVGVLLNIFLSNVLVVLGGLVLCLYTSWKLTVLAFTSIGPIMYLTGLYSQWSRSLNRDIYEAYAEGNAVSNEAISNIRTVRANCTDTREYARFRDALNIVRDRMKLDVLASSSTYTLTSYLDFATGVLILWFGGSLVLQSDGRLLTLGKLVTFELYWNQMNSSYQSLNGIINSLIRAAAAAQRVFSLLDCKPDIEAPAPTHTALQPVNGTYDEPSSRTEPAAARRWAWPWRRRGEGNALVAPELGVALLPPSDDVEGGNGGGCWMIAEEAQWDMRLCGVEFTYQMRPDNPVLNGIHIAIPAGTTCALVGRSGGGKSTIVHLLLRYYDPQQGSIQINNKPITDVNLRWYRSQIGLVSQETHLFNTSIKENIAYGYEKPYTMEDIRGAARKAFADDFITALEDGYDTRVGEGGNRLSGGQKQRISIARAMLKKPRLLLLDEATSALDSESEAVVQRALDALMIEMKGRCTIVLVAHRLSTVINADNIVVLHQGQVAEQGTHEQLLEKGGSYFSLVSRQIGKDKNTLQQS
eukprot:GHVS01053587.1.p1 GENE.GHVS01053587.1~~GHVS01053587.1.p1  ORF type:complete len:1269 (+),score=222.60 GHVS01053587.1:495-3809(+)